MMDLGDLDSWSLCMLLVDSVDSFVAKKASNVSQMPLYMQHSTIGFSMRHI